MHSCFTSFISFAARTLDFTVKFRFVFRYEAVVFRRYVLALLSVGLLRKFEAYPVYSSLIRSKNLRRFSFFQKFGHFTYMLLWFHLVIPSFPARIDDMRSRFSALSHRSRNLSSQTHLLFMQSKANKWPPFESGGWILIPDETPDETPPGFHLRWNMFFIWDQTCFSSEIKHLHFNEIFIDYTTHGN